ncbi:MAG: response regulator [Deltaproteobacteria bacterium]|nr:response regulator [Deltaproteobacteria bacterium]
MEMMALHLLILEDNPDDAELAVKELERQGFDVKWTRVDTEKAFRKTLAQKPDLILVDYSLPSFDGLAALEVHRQLDLDIPIIIVSGTIGEEMAVECMKFGATDYVLKDNLSRLGPVVKRALDKMKIYRKSRQAEKALRESKSRYKRLYSMTRLMCDNLPELIWAKDSENKFIFANKACCEQLLNAKDTDEPIGKTDMYFSNREKESHPENPEYHTFGETCTGSDLVVLETEKPLRSNEFGNLQGKLVYLDVSKAPFRDENGNLIGTVGCARDITKEKEIERKQKKEKEEKLKLETQLRQSQKMEAIGVLAGGIAHDFNNILTTIIGNADLSLMDGIENEQLRNDMKEIKKAGEKAASLTRQLLAFSRKQIIKPKFLDINELLTDMEKMLGRLIGEDIELLTIPAPALWQIKIDPGQIEQILLNMVVNAKDAMPQGGSLTIETANADLNENYFREHGIEGKMLGHYVILTVSDTGIGMDKETREHIFEPFFTTKEIGKGTGLGLSTVYGVVKQNNGFVWVYSEPGQGSTFKIYFPEAKKDAGPEEKQQTTAFELDGSETILIVEDDDSLRTFVQKVLQSYGYRCLDAENGEDALRVCKEYDGQIDLMITDVVMPKMGGGEAAKRLQPLYPQMKVIYMSGYTDNAIVHHGVLEPGLNFLEKPFTTKVLMRKVREALE